MRLIDADKLILHLNDYALAEASDERESAGERRASRIVYTTIQNCMKAIEEQPTAFDVNGVVEQLKNEADRSYADFEKYADEVGITETTDDDWHYMGLKRAIEIIKAEEHRRSEKNGWIPVDELLPDPDKYLLISFKNFSVPMVGRYTADDEDNRTFRIGDDDETFKENDLFVNAWMYLPKCYRKE